MNASSLDVSHSPTWRPSAVRRRARAGANIRGALNALHCMSSFLSKGQIRVAEEDFGGANRCSRCLKRGCARNEKKKDLTKI